MDLNSIELMRKKNPVVLNYANFVTPFLVANGLNAVGASPIMSNEDDEARQLVEIASAVVVNLGTARREDETFIQNLCKIANELGKPLVLDPVAVGATSYRKELGMNLLEKFHFSIIRGNLGEIATLAGVAWQAHGIDAGESQSQFNRVAKACAQKYQTVVIASGETDYISDGKRLIMVQNNTKLLPLIVGSGDLLSGVAGAFCAINDDTLEAALIASLVVSCSGERAADKLNNQNLPGTFLNELQNQLANINSKQIQEMMRVEEE